MFVCPVSETVDPESGFHNRIDPSSLPVITKSQSGETSSAEISELGSRSTHSVAMS